MKTKLPLLIYLNFFEAIRFGMQILVSNMTDGNLDCEAEKNCKKLDSILPALKLAFESDVDSIIYLSDKINEISHASLTKFLQNNESSSIFFSDSWKNSKNSILIQGISKASENNY